MAEGQYSGVRANYVYTSDDGTDYIISTDKTLGDIPGADLQLATTGSDASALPKRFRPRVVYWQGTLSGRIVRKKIICDSTSTLYQDNKSVALTIDGVAGFTTGRRGEKMSYLKLNGTGGAVVN